MFELVIPILLVTWMIKAAGTELAYAIRGEVPPRQRVRLQKGQQRYGVSGYVVDLWDDAWRAKTEQRRNRGPQPKRYGARGYVADRWEDAWVRAGIRHHERQQQRERPAEPMYRPTPRPEPQPNRTQFGLPPEPNSPEYTPPKVGDRYTDPDTYRVQEWDGEVWAPVCSECNLPMRSYGKQGWLICHNCGERAVDQPHREGSRIPVGQYKHPDSRPQQTGGTMTAPTTAFTGEIVGVDQARHVFDQFGGLSAGALDTAGALKQQAEAAARAAENAAAGMAAGKFHADTLGDVAEMQDAAGDLLKAAEWVAQAAERLGVASQTARQGLEQRDGLVADAAASVGNAAEREALVN